MSIRWIAAVIVAGALMVGCESKEETSVPQTPAADAAKPATPDAGAMPDAAAQPAASTTQPAGEAMAAASAEAQKLVDQAMQYIKDNKLDLAEKAVTQAEAMKSSLTPTLQSAVEKARSALTAAKASGMVPGMPK